MTEKTVKLIEGAKKLKEGCELLAEASCNSVEWGIIECVLLQGEGELDLEGTAEKAQELIGELLEAYVEDKTMEFFMEVADDLELDSGDFTPDQELKFENIVKDYINQNLNL